MQVPHLMSESDVTWQSLSEEMVVHWSDPKSCLCVRDHWVYRYQYASRKLERVCRIPAKDQSWPGLLKDWFARSWLGQRLSPKAGLGHVGQLANGDIYIVYDRIYLYRTQQSDCVATIINHDLLPKLAAPLRGGIAVHAKSQCIYFGEYLNGHSRDIRLVQIDPVLQSVKVCATFSRQEIKHIHSVSYDPYRNRIWICTGDLDHESAFYFTDDEFNSLHKFAGGDQSWRAIGLLFDQDGMEWGMDAGKDAPATAINKLYRYDFTTEVRTELAVIGNPAYFVGQFSDGTAMMQTTYEPGRLQDTPEQAALWFRNQQRQWRQVLALPYLHQPRLGVSKYGYILIPSGVSPAGQLLFSPINCQSGHYQLLQLQLPTT
jgi:hypothetical protein